jgi:hypothetical protein
MNRTSLTVLNAARTGRQMIAQSTENHIVITIQDEGVDERTSIIINLRDWYFFLNRLNVLMGPHD